MTVEIVTQRMVESAPDQYHTSRLYVQIQQAVAIELQKVKSDNDDVRKQLHLRTATWGLKYWEEGVRIPTIEADPYDIRRSRVLARLRSTGNFSADQIRRVASSYSNGEVDVRIDHETGVITVEFIGTLGVPPNMKDLEKAVDDILHAHLEVAYVVRYLTWDMTDAANLTWDQVDALNRTWDEWATTKLK